MCFRRIRNCSRRRCRSSGSASSSGSAPDAPPPPPRSEGFRRSPMTWDADVYMKFADERTRPAMELLARVPITSPARVIDLGCGPGNSTALLAARWPNAQIEGLESSPEMLVKARASGVRATWIEGDVESWKPDARYDVVFSNATLH